MSIESVGVVDQPDLSFTDGSGAKPAAAGSSIILKSEPERHCSMFRVFSALLTTPFQRLPANF